MKAWASGLQNSSQVRWAEEGSGSSYMWNAWHCGSNVSGSASMLIHCDPRKVLLLFSDQGVNASVLSNMPIKLMSRPAGVWTWEVQLHSTAFSCLFCPMTLVLKPSWVAHHTRSSICMAPTNHGSKVLGKTPAGLQAVRTCFPHHHLLVSAA